MSGEQADAPAQADVPALTDAPAPAPFAMIAGDPSAAVCEGDACLIPGFEPAGSLTDH
ncbi:hypothetical protein [Agromyces sp. SYSU T00194]|uniref:hypothetical protein n=1 Tax=Agromyces chitinivorans TaxID=3158560 RepID=UPI00339B8848